MSGSQRKKKVDRLTFLGTLAGGLVHEIKNPLSTISVNLQLLKEDWADAKSQKEVRALKRVNILQREIKRLESIANDFLNYAKGFSLEPRPSDLNHLIRELIDFLEPEAMRAQIRITTLLAPSLPKVDLDWKYMQKAFLNIFHNAFQALADMDENLREVLVSTRKADKGVEVVITDTGSGIAPELQEKIFQVFFSTKRDGTGMGLPTVKRIVEEHDGTLSVLSEVGKGTSFVMHLPCGRARPGTDERDPAERDPAEPGSRGDPKKKQ